MVKAASVANPADPRLLAQLLYCEASLGNMEAAERLLAELENLAKKGDGYRSVAAWETLLNADRGLLLFRGGDPVQGRVFYEKALEIAALNKLPEFAASALLNYAREEALANPAIGLDREALARAVDAFPPAARGVMTRFVQRMGIYP